MALPTKSRKATHYNHHDRVRTSKKEAYTNVDRMPIMGEHVSAVLQEVRAFKLAQRDELRKLREARAALLPAAPPSEPDPSAPEAGTADPAVQTEGATAE